MKIATLLIFGFGIGLWTDRYLIVHGWTGNLGTSFYATHICK